MNLKKINPNLQRAFADNGLIEANELQVQTFGTIKSGTGAIIIAPKNYGKTTTIVLNVIQKIEKTKDENVRALIIVQSKDKVIEMEEMFLKYACYHDFSYLGVHEKGDFDYDKNIISLGLDVLIGTPQKINDLFSSAGFNINTVKMFAVDDADILFKNRMDAIILRLSNSIDKTQFLFFAEKLTERIETIADKIMINPVWFEFEKEEI